MDTGTPDPAGWPPPVPGTRLVLLHGAATSSRVWRRVLPFLPPGAVLVPDRPATGRMQDEIAFLAPLCEDAVVVGVSGGATLGLELLARGVPVRAALLHEPAAGSLAPGLLAHVRDGLAEDGVRGFGRALYGPAWTLAETSAPLDVVRAEFAMFGGFEPRDLGAAAARVVVTVGADSPSARHRSVAALGRALGVSTAVLPGTAHAAHLEAPRALGTAVRRLVEELEPARPPG